MLYIVTNFLYFSFFFTTLSLSDVLVKLRTLYSLQLSVYKIKRCTHQKDPSIILAIKGLCHEHDFYKAKVKKNLNIS